jgi:hypothetical protein
VTVVIAAVEAEPAAENKNGPVSRPVHFPHRILSESAEESSSLLFFRCALS